MDEKAMTKCRLKQSERADLLLEPNSASAHLHFASCPSCAQAFEQQLKLFSALDAWTVPEVSSGFNRNLYAKIDAALATPRYERWATAIRHAFAQPSFAVAAIALVAGSGFLLDHPAGLTNPSRFIQTSSAQHATALKVSSKEAEQVERTLEDLEMLHQFDTGSDEKENLQKSM